MSKNTGKIYWANSQLIDKSDNKKRRLYAVVRDNKNYVSVAKIRGLNDNLKNEKRLYILDLSKYPLLTKPSGVDNKAYSRKADKKNSLLKLDDRDVFDNEFYFKLSSHDTFRVISHIEKNKKKK